MCTLRSVGSIALCCGAPPQRRCAGPGEQGAFHPGDAWTRGKWVVESGTATASLQVNRCCSVAVGNILDECASGPRRWPVWPSSIVAQRRDGIETCRAPCRVKAENHAHGDGESD